MFAAVILGINENGRVDENHEALLVVTIAREVKWGSGVPGSDVIPKTATVACHSYATHCTSQHPGMCHKQKGVHVVRTLTYARGSQ
jgi:hypothetical protein